MGRKNKNSKKQSSVKGKETLLAVDGRDYTAIITIETLASWVVIVSAVMFLSVYFLSISFKSDVAQYIIDITPPTTMVEAAKYSSSVGALIFLALIFGILPSFIHYAINHEKSPYLKRILWALYGLVPILLIITAIWCTENAVFSIVWLMLVLVICLVSKKFTVGSISVLYTSVIILSLTAINIQDSSKKVLKGYPIIMHTSIEGYQSIRVCKISRIGGVLKLKTPGGELVIGASTFLHFSDVSEDSREEIVKICQEINEK